MEITKTKKDHAEVSLSGTLPSQEVEKFYSEAIKTVTKEVSIAGFRKGHVPEDRIIEEVGKNFLWKEAAERALREQLEDIVKKEEIMPVAPLSISLKNSEHGADVDFEITVITPPTATLENYKEVAKKALDELPEQDKEKEKQEAMRAFRTQVRGINKMSNPEEVKEGDAKENEDKADKPLDDAEAKLVGLENGKAAEHFIEGEAEKAVADRYAQLKRSSMAEALIGAATSDIPTFLINDEAGALLETFKKEVKSQGLEWSEYLKRVNKTDEQVKGDLVPNAEKRISLDLIFANIVREEKLQLDEDEKKKQEEFAKKLAEQGVEQTRAQSYAHEQFLREKVWNVLGITTDNAVS